MDEKYVVMALKSSGTVMTDLEGIEGQLEIPMIWAEGMVGVLPVFDNLEHATVYAEGKYKISPVKMGVTP